MSPDISVIFLRIGCAFLAGLVLGIERESHGRAAGLRTLVLVAVAAATAALLSDDYYNASFVGEHKSVNWHPDPARLGAGILTGIGFLGAGVILRHGNLVRGVTTASLIWVVTILGLCFGSGQLLLGFSGFALCAMAVFVLPYLEGCIKRDWYATISVTADLEGLSVADLCNALMAMGINVKNVELNYDLQRKTRTIRCSLKFKKVQLTELPDTAVKRVLALPGVHEVDWK